MHISKFFNLRFGSGGRQIEAEAGDTNVVLVTVVAVVASCSWVDVGVLGQGVGVGHGGTQNGSSQNTYPLINPFHLTPLSDSYVSVLLHLNNRKRLNIYKHIAHQSIVFRNSWNVFTAGFMSSNRVKIFQLEIH